MFVKVQRMSASGCRGGKTTEIVPEGKLVMTPLRSTQVMEEV